jgi:ABC-2 type transport system permease protein
MRRKKMISIPLLKQTIKSNWGLWLVATLTVSLLYIVIKFAMGSIAVSSDTDPNILVPYITALEASGLTIEGLFISIGINPDILTGLATMDGNVLVSIIFYPVVAVLLPLVYTVIVGNKLFASQIDRGSMAFILSTSIKRSKIAITQMTFLICSLVLMFLFTALVDVTLSIIIDNSLAIDKILLLNVGLLLFSIAMGSLTYMFSAIFNYSKYSLSFGGGLALVFFISKILGLFGSDLFMNMGIGIEPMGFFNKITMISLFNTTSILDDSSNYLLQFIILILISIICFTIGGLWFTKKDIPV